MTSVRHTGVQPERSRLIRLTGELQTTTISTARRSLWPTSDLPAPLIVDLGGVSFVDSAGVGLLLILHREITRRGGRWALVGASESVARMLAITQADRMLPLFPSLAAVERAWSERATGHPEIREESGPRRAEPVSASQRLNK